MSLVFVVLQCLNDKNIMINVFNFNPKKKIKIFISLRQISLVLYVLDF